MLGTSVDSLGFPSVARVVFGFLVTVALAVGVAFVLRRGWPVWPLVLGRKPPGSGMRSIERAAVSRTMTVHLVEVEGTRVIIAEGRSGVGIAVMPPRTGSPTAGGAPAPVSPQTGGPAAYVPPQTGDSTAPPESPPTANPAAPVSPHAGGPTASVQPQTGGFAE